MQEQPIANMRSAAEKIERRVRGFLLNATQVFTRSAMGMRGVFCRGVRIPTNSGTGRRYSVTTVTADSVMSAWPPEPAMAGSWLLLAGGDASNIG